MRIGFGTWQFNNSSDAGRIKSRMVSITGSLLFRPEVFKTTDGYKLFYNKFRKPWTNGGPIAGPSTAPAAKL